MSPQPRSIWDALGAVGAGAATGVLLGHYLETWWIVVVAGFACTIIGAIKADWSKP